MIHMKLLRFIPLLFVILVNPVFSQTGTDYDSNWPNWRGPLANGIAPKSNPPVSWSEGKNIKWRTAIPGKGFSTPIVWDKYVFVTTAIQNGGAAGSATVLYL